MITNAPHLSGLSIERLNSFCRVSESGSIKEAADSDPTRQSQYSRQIKDLEQALGVTLFDRSSKRWVLTEEGRRLVVICRNFFKSLAEISHEADNSRWHLKIGSGDGVLAWYVAPHLESIRQTTPRISFDCRNLRTHEIARQLSEGEIDIGILREDALPDGLGAYDYAEMEYLLLVPRALLPGKSAAGLDLIKDLPMAGLSGGGLFQRSVDRILQDRNLNPRVFFRAGSFVLLSQAMQTMQLAGILPSKARQAFSEETFACIAMDEFAVLKRKLVVAVNPELTLNNPQIESVALQLQAAM